MLLMRRNRLVLYFLVEHVLSSQAFFVVLRLWGSFGIVNAFANSRSSQRNVLEIFDRAQTIKQTTTSQDRRHTRTRAKPICLNVVSHFTPRESAFDLSTQQQSKRVESKPLGSSNTAVTSTSSKKSLFRPASTSLLSSAANASSNNSPPSVNLASGAVGNWESLHGNWILRPTSGIMDGPPRAVIHFLGGALVGAAPQITYRYLLEKLADNGFLIVATPYNLSFDHLATCDQVLTKFENLAPTLARQYGALPVVGIGHSCGALLHLLITCLFPDTPRAANALLSFNNKPVSEAVPFFEEFFAPVFTSIAAPSMIDVDGTKAVGPSSNDSLTLGLKLAMAATQGQLPSDDLLQEAQRVFKISLGPPPGFPLPFPSISPPPLFPFFGGYASNPISISHEIREAYREWAAPSLSQLKEAGVLALIHETIVSLDQIPKLVEEVRRGYTNGVAEGARDFNPSPALVKSAAGKAYRARRTLIIGYDNDPIDESDELEEVLREALSITRMRRPMVEIDVQRKTFNGGHEAPLVAPPLEVVERAEDWLGPKSSKDFLGYASASATADDLVRWLEEGNL